MSNGMEGPQMGRKPADVQERLEAAKNRLAETIERALKKPTKAPPTLEQLFGAKTAALMSREAQARDDADRRRLPDY